MKRNRTVLLTLLILLLLDLMLFFTSVPTVGRNGQSVFAQHADAEFVVCQTLDTEDHTEDESEFSRCGISAAHGPACGNRRGYAGPVFCVAFRPSAVLACGWQMPLRI